MLDTLGQRDRGDSSFLKRLSNKLMAVRKRTVKTGAGVVIRRHREEEFVRLYPTRVDRVSTYLLVKQVFGNCHCRSGHPTRGRSQIHFMSASPAASNLWRDSARWLISG